MEGESKKLLNTQEENLTMDVASVMTNSGYGPATCSGFEIFGTFGWTNE